MSMKWELKHSQIVSRLFIFLLYFYYLLRRKAIDFIMPNDGIYTRPSLFCNTIIENIKVIFSLSDSDDLNKSISEYYII